MKNSNFPASRRDGISAAPSIQLDGARKEALDTGRHRLVVTGVLLTMAFSVIAARLVDLAAMGDGVDRPASDRSSGSSLSGQGGYH